MAVKGELTSKVAELLRRDGFQVVDCQGIRSCFDLFARRGETLFVIKVVSNVEGFTSKSSVEIRQVANMLSGLPLIVTERMKHSDLKDGVIYSRHGVNVVTLNTLEGVIESTLASTYSIRGNYCTQLNPEKLVSLRKKYGLNQEDLAREVGVSKQSIYRYESSGRAAVDVAERLEEFFGQNLRKEFGFFDLEGELQRPAKLEFGRDYHITELKRRVLQCFRDMGFSTSLTNAPFNVMASDSELKRMREKPRRGRTMIEVLSVVTNDPQKLDKRVSVVNEISEMVGGYSMTISERSFDVESKVIRPRDLEGISKRKELIRFLKEI
ncbi:helix-turn-helix domain-containing protein [Candidatus Altiarchaeota archaeon]